jgi:1-acyl-sn-glycerol-3-phosphate acyltransferase
MLSVSTRLSSASARLPEPSLVNSFVYNTATEITRRVLLPLYTRIQVTGIENVPLQGPLIIASNHLNDADPGIICTRIPRKVAFMAKIELFRVPLLSQFLRAFGAFPVERGKADLAALRQATQALLRGQAVCIFPEGTREGPAERLTEGWPGAALLALRHDVDILPIAITGSGRLNIPRMFLRLLRRRAVTFTVGTPFRLDRPARINAEAATEGTRRIMERIAALLPADHQGYYEYVSGRGTNTHALSE